MNILLIRPPTYCKDFTYPAGPRFGVPLGLLSLAAVLEKEGHTVSIYDSLIDCDMFNLQKDENGVFHVGAR